MCGAYAFSHYQLPYCKVNLYSSSHTLRSLFVIAATVDADAAAVFVAYASFFPRFTFHFPLFCHVNFILCTITAIHIEININPILFSPYSLYAVSFSAYYRLPLSLSPSSFPFFYFSFFPSFILTITILNSNFKIRCSIVVCHPADKHTLIRNL